jgi:uncharacterized protein (DUF58 family)
MSGLLSIFGEMRWYRAANNWFLRHEQDILMPAFTRSFPFITLRFKKIDESTKTYKWGFLGFIMNVWNERLTFAGRWIVGGAVGSIIAGSSPEPEIGRYLFSFFLSLIGTSFIISLARTPKVSVKRWVSARFPANTSVPLVMNLRNIGADSEADVGAYEFRMPPGIKLEEPPMFVEELLPGAEYAQRYTIHAAKRGTYLLPGPAIISIFPFGLSQSRQFKLDPTRVFVHPEFKPIKSIDLPISSRHQPGGIALSSNVGESMEFIGTREYTSGDRIRHIHPRSWARVGMPIVRQFQEEYFTRVALLADTFVPGTEELDAFEAQLSLIASITEHLSREEYVLDLFAIGDKMLEFESGRSLAYQDQVLDVLSVVEPTDTDHLEVLAHDMDDQLRVTSTIIVVILRWDRVRRELVDRIVSTGVMVKVILVSDTEPDTNDISGHQFMRLSPEQIHMGVDTL